MRMTKVDHPKRLFRYTRADFADQMLAQGIVSLGPADLYRRQELTEAQRDDERSRVYTPDAARLRIMTARPNETPKQIHGVRDVRVTYQMPGYYLLCLAEEITPAMTAAYSTDTCIESFDPTEFFERLDKAVARQIPIYRFWTGPINYVSKNGFPEKPNNLDLIFTKFDNYAYQREYRVALFSEDETPPDARLFFRLGPLNDVCR